VERFLAFCPVMGTTQRFPVDRNDSGHDVHEIVDPIEKAPLKHLRIDSREYSIEGIMGENAIG
jgi:hypothetical protein